MNLLGFGKKAQLNNYMVVILFVFSFGVNNIIGYLLLTKIIQGYTDAGLYSGALAETGNKILWALRINDNMIVILAVALIVAVGITSFKLRTAPIFFLVTWIMGIFLGFVSYIFNFMFAEIVSEPVFNAVTVYWSNTILLCTNLHWIALVTIAVGSITLYAKKGRPDDLGAF